MLQVVSFVSGYKESTIFWASLLFFDLYYFLHLTALGFLFFPRSTVLVAKTVNTFRISIPRVAGEKIVYY